MLDVIVSLALVAAAGPAAAPAFENHTVTADRLPFKPEAPGVPAELAPLWGNRATGEAGTLLRVPAGFKSGVHWHTADYWAIAISGEWEHWVSATGDGRGVRLRPGAHWTQKHSQPHEDACVSREPCVIFLFNKEPYVTHFPGK